MPSREVGIAAEQRALDYLTGRGLTLVESNYRSRFGEIDLILRDSAVLVFAEVRMRSSNDFGGARASITPAKQAKLIKTAQQYLTQFTRPPPCRFDAVLLGAARDGTIEWIKNAFTAD
jgi:putative endonuclease